MNKSSHLNELSTDDEIDLLALLGTLLDYRWLIILVTFLFSFLGVVYALIATPIYQANALIQIEDRKSGLAGLDVMDDLFSGKSQATTEIEIIKSRMVIGKAVDNLKLDITATATYFPLIGARFARSFKPQADKPIADAFLGLNSYDWGGSQLEVFVFEVPDYLLNQTFTLIARNDQQYQLYYENTLLIEGKVGESYHANGIKIAISELQARAGQVFQITKTSPLKAIKNYQEAIGISELGKQSNILNLTIKDASPQKALLVLNEIAAIYVKQNVDRSSAEASNSLDFLRQQLPNIKKDMELAESRLNAYQIDAKSADITIETQAILNQLVKADAELSELRLKKLEMDKLFTSAHPSYQTLLNQMASLEESKTKLEQRVSNLPEVQQELLRLKRDVSVSSQIYMLLLQKSQELDIARASSVGNVRIIDPAAVDVTRPVAPKKMLIVLIATVLGGILSVLIAIIHNLINRGVETIEEIESLDLSVFASIPYSSLQIDTRGKGKAKVSSIPLLSVHHPEDLAIEAFRSLHTSLHFTIPEAKNNVLMISGSSPKIGKSFVATNTAAVMAQAGKKILLIDADMRKGHLHYYFDNKNERGFSSLLSAQCTIEQCLQKTQVQNLDFIPRGPIPPNPGELLLGTRFEENMAALSEQYDLIIIDTPPVLAVADALIVGKYAGSNFITIRFGKNPIGEIKAAVKSFEDNGVALKGAIFNAVEKRASSYYKYGYYNYQYSYKSDSK